jgi:Fe-S-cluster containining protein
MSLGMTQEAFTRAVEERAKQNSFLIALYQTLGEYQMFEHRQGPNQPACCKFCSLCCHQMVCVFSIEMIEIHRYIMQQASPARSQFRERIREGVRKWQVYLHEHRFSPAKIQDPLQLAEGWSGEPCPLLREDDSCGIYEARPLVCRIVTSQVRCTELAHPKGGEHFVQMKYDCERWANDLLMEEMWRQGLQGVTPIHYFFWMQEFKV